MSTLERTLANFPPPKLRAVAWTTMMMIVGLVIVAATTKVDRIATADGVFAPQGTVRVIQHLEGGIAVDILVREGDAVVAGQPILRLDLGADALGRAETEVKLDALRIERIRLLAEVSQLDFALPDMLRDRRPELAAAEEATFLSRRREYESNQKLLADRIVQKELEVASIAARLDAARQRLAPLREQYEVAAGLADKGLKTRTEVLRLEVEVRDVEGEISSLDVALPLAQAGLAEARERRMLERNRFRSAAASRLREVEIEVARQQDLLARAVAQEERTVVRSPTAGVVKSLRIKTVGGVVRAGEPIAEVVPSEERLVVEARLSPEDIGHVAIGQRVGVKLATYDFLRYGTLDGEISQIAADATQDGEGRHYFRLVIRTDALALQVDDDSYPVSAGMEATVDIKLGRRTMLEYLLDPVLKLRAEAFQDR